MHRKQQVYTENNKYTHKTTNIHRKQQIYTESNKYTQKTRRSTPTVIVYKH